MAKIFGVHINNEIQTKILTGGNIISTGVLTDLTMNNLVAGEWYEVSGQVYHADSGTGIGVLDSHLQFQHDGNTVGASRRYFAGGGTTLNNLIHILGVNFKFPATANGTLVANLVTATNSGIFGDGTRAATFIQLNHIKGIVPTTKFN